MTTHKNPYIKTNQAPSYEVPAYTPDNFFAQMDWNKEIENNKQGYLAVDQMTMKEFYDAGGYAFINDYYGELTDVDAAYDRAKPSYGVKGEQMAQAGLTGSGFSDYLGGKAYAGRVAGQAMARQNAMAQSNAFRSAYNQYLTTVRTKRDENLQTVIDRAISVNMNPDNFTDVATKLGIPQADAERGKEQLIAYYQGLSGTGTGTSAGSTTGSASDNSFLGLNTVQTQEAKAMKGSLQAALMGYIDTESGEEVAPTAPTVDAALAKYYGSTYSKDDPRVQAAIKELQFDTLGQVVGEANVGNYLAAKSQLDNLVTMGVVDKDSEQYKATLAKVQESTAKDIESVVTSGDLDSYTELLQKLGYKAEDITEENAGELLSQRIQDLVKDGMLTYDAAREIHAKEFENDFKEFEGNESDFEAIVVEAMNTGFNSYEIAGMLGNAKLYTERKALRPHVTIKLNENTEFSYRLTEADHFSYTDKDRENIKLLGSTGENGELAYVNGSFYRKVGKRWEPTAVIVPYSKPAASKAIDLLIASMIPKEMVISSGSKKATEGITN